MKRDDFYKLLLSTESLEKVKHDVKRKFAHKKGINLANFSSDLLERLLPDRVRVAEDVSILMPEAFIASKQRLNKLRGSLDL